MIPLPDVRRLVLGLSALLVVFFFVGCDSPEPKEPSEEALADSLADGYRWLERQYEQREEFMPPAMRGMRSQMQGMHGPMMRGRDSVRGRGGRGGMMGRMGGMMGRRGEGASSRDTSGRRFRMGHGDMSAMHETMARMHSEQRARMAARHRKMARWHEQMMGGSADEPVQTPGESAQVPDDAVRSGATLFARQCASCHGQNGQGVAGTFPPLTDSEWVTGDVSVLARIVLHGLEGPIEVGGQRYSGVMPAFGNRLSDPEVARLLTYLRTSLNEESAPVSSEEVAEIRAAHADRTRPWTGETLRRE